MSKEIRLLRVLENNLSSYYKQIRAYKKRQIIEMAGSVAERNELFQYLTDVLFDLSQEEIDLLLCFKNPLSVVSKVWEQHQSTMGGYEDALDYLVFLADTVGIYDGEQSDPDFDDDFYWEEDFFE